MKSLHAVLPRAVLESQIDDLRESIHRDHKCAYPFEAPLIPCNALERASVLFAPLVCAKRCAFATTYVSILRLYISYTSSSRYYDSFCLSFGVKWFDPINSRDHVWHRIATHASVKWIGLVSIYAWYKTANNRRLFLSGYVCSSMSPDREWLALRSLRLWCMGDCPRIR